MLEVSARQDDLGARGDFPYFVTNLNAAQVVGQRQVGDYKGSQQDFQLLLEHSTFKYVGFGLGINTVDINIRAQDDELRGEFDSRILGLLGYIKFYL